MTGYGTSRRSGLDSTAVMVVGIDTYLPYLPAQTTKSGVEAIPSISNLEVESGAIQTMKLSPDRQPTRPAALSPERGEERGRNPKSVSAPNICYTIDIRRKANATHTRHETHSCHAGCLARLFCLSRGSTG